MHFTVSSFFSFKNKSLCINPERVASRKQDKKVWHVYTKSCTLWKALKITKDVAEARCVLSYGGFPH